MVALPNVARDLSTLAKLLQATNRLSEAEPLVRRVVEIFRDFGKAMGHEHPDLQVVVNNYKRLLAGIGLSNEQALERVQDIFLSESGR